MTMVTGGSNTSTMSPMLVVQTSTMNSLAKLDQAETCRFFHWNWGVRLEKKDDSVRVTNLDQTET